MKKPKLIKGWKQSWKRFSVQALAASAAISGAYLSIPEEVRALIPAEVTLGITGAVAVLGAIGSLIDQGLKNE